MPAADKCPFCGSSKIVPGRVKSDGHGFLPDENTGGFTLRNLFAFDFGPAATYCGACSMVWSKADAKDAAKFINKFGTGELQARLAAPETAPTKA